MPRLSENCEECACQRFVCMCVCVFSRTKWHTISRRETHLTMLYGMVRHLVQTGNRVIVTHYTRIKGSELWILSLANSIRVSVLGNYRITFDVVQVLIVNAKRVRESHTFKAKVTLQTQFNCLRFIIIINNYVYSRYTLKQITLSLPTSVIPRKLLSFAKAIVATYRRRLSISMLWGIHFVMLNNGG